MIETPTLRIIYKALTIIVLTYVIVAGLTFSIPNIGGNIQQTSRNLFFHVPMWFSMYLMMGLSVYYSIRYMKNSLEIYDWGARESAAIGVGYGLLGLTTGSVWSRVTWGELLPATDPTAWWAWDPKQTYALVAVLVYLAYFLLRNSIEINQQRAKVSAVYNIFAAASLVPLTLIIPRIVGGLHPGGDDGSPVFDSKDISNEYRMIFYPAIIGFMLLGLWIFELRMRVLKIEQNLNKNN